MTVDDITSTEWDMFEKGYASVRLVALKINLSRATVARRIRDGYFVGTKIGRNTYVLMTDVAGSMDKSAADLLNLTDWSDIYDT